MFVGEAVAVVVVEMVVLRRRRHGLLCGEDMYEAVLTGFWLTERRCFQSMRVLGRQMDASE